MPKGPQDQKRSEEALGCAAMVEKIGAGEKIAELEEPSGKFHLGEAWTKVLLPNLATGERSAVAMEAAGGRWD